MSFALSTVLHDGAAIGCAEIDGKRNADRAASPQPSSGTPVTSGTWPSAGVPAATEPTRRNTPTR